VRNNTETEPANPGSSEKRLLNKRLRWWQWWPTLSCHWKG